MKNVFTLNKATALVAFLMAFTTVSAASGDDSTCKIKCCKAKKAATVIIFSNVEDLSLMKAEIKAFARKAKVFKNVRRMNSIPFISFSAAFDPIGNETEAKHKINFNELEKEMDKVQEELSQFENKEDNKQKINFNALDKEMNQVQEELSQMDEPLKTDEAKNRKTAEEILKTGIKI